MCVWVCVCVQELRYARLSRYYYYYYLLKPFNNLLWSFVFFIFWGVNCWKEKKIELLQSKKYNTYGRHSHRNMHTNRRRRIAEKLQSQVFKWDETRFRYNFFFHINIWFWRVCTAHILQHERIKIVAVHNTYIYYIWLVRIHYIFYMR